METKFKVETPFHLTVDEAANLKPRKEPIMETKFKVETPFHPKFDEAYVQPRKGIRMETKFKVGQRVRAPTVFTGVGIISEVGDPEGRMGHVVVQLNDNQRRWFYPNGKQWTDAELPALEIVRDEPKPGFWRLEGEGASGIYAVFGKSSLKNNWMIIFTSVHESCFEEYLGPLDWNEDGTLKYPEIK